MKTIYKYPVTSFIQMPEDSRILTLQLQNGAPCIWAYVDTEKPLIERAFKIYGTGQHIKEERPLAHIGTYQLNEGTLVLHVFEVITL